MMAAIIVKFNDLLKGNYDAIPDEYEFTVIISDNDFTTIGIMTGIAVYATGNKFKIVPILQYISALSTLSTLANKTLTGKTIKFVASGNIAKSQLGEVDRYIRY